MAEPEVPKSGSEWDTKLKNIVSSTTHPTEPNPKLPMFGEWEDEEPTRKGAASVPKFGAWNKNPAQADGYTAVFYKLQNDKRFDLYRDPLHTPMKQTKQSKRPKSGSLGAGEPMLSGFEEKPKDALTIPHKPEMSRDASPSQTTNPTAIVAKNRGANESEKANSHAVAVNSAGGVPIEQEALIGTSNPVHPLLGGSASDRPSSSLDRMHGTSVRSPHRSNARPAPNWTQSGAGNNGYKPMEKLKERVCDVVFCKKNLGVLQTKLQVLTEEVAQVHTLLMSGENDTEDEVQLWLAEADEVLQETNGILESTNNMAGKKRLCGTCWDPRFSWETGEMSRDIDKILERRKGLDLSSYFYKKLESRENKLQDILEALMGIHTNMIGIYGMIGIGKSVLAKELARRAQNEHLFDVVLMVQASDSFDIKLIQTQIANKIGLQLSDDDDEETRSYILYNKLDEKVTENGQENNSRSIQQSKILVILDGIQHVIDLMKVGIPYRREGRSRCKVVLLSRSANVCKEMGAEKNFSVECLDLDEAKILFKESLKDKIQTMEITLEEYEYMESAVLMKCGGLPLMINSLACALRSMSWSNWEIIADQMVRNSLLEVDAVKEVPSAILELCNNFLRKGEKEKFFLLCCFIHEQGVDVTLDKLMRYGIGFGLFEVDSLTSIVDQINSWVQELKAMSLLLEDEPHHIKIHDIIQNVAISALYQDNLLVLLDSGTSWHTRESYENCVAISMKHDSNYKCLNGLELHKLQAILFMMNEQSLNLQDDFFQRMQGLEILDIPDNFFRGMQNLKILEISGTKFVELPSSIGDLKNLVTLHLENCDIQCEIISTVSKLHKLEVLSLRGSSINVLPEEIGNLTNLRVLDLTNCENLRTFCLDAVMKMDRLRELYMYNSYAGWQIGDVNRLRSLPLEVLELKMYHYQVSPNTSNHKLRRFRICIEGLYGPLENSRCFSSTILIRGSYNPPVGEHGLRDLMPCVEHLQIESVIRDLPNSICDLYADVFLHLRSIYIVSSQMKYILDTSRDIFPKLEILVLEDLFNLKSICHWPPLQTFFSQLRELRLKKLSHLHPYVLPVQFVVKLRVMEVNDCFSLLYIFPPDITNETNGADLIREFPFMERLELVDLPRLRALQNSLEDSIKRYEHQRPLRLLFNDKIKLPSLKMMTLKGLRQVENVWDFSGSKEHSAELLQSQPYGKTPCYGNLKSMTVSECHRLKSLFPSTIVNSLLQLETLEVDTCGEMKEVITSIDAEDEASTTTLITFPKLKVLRLKWLNNLQCFYRGRHLVKFPKLKEMDLIYIWEMKAFTLPTTQSIETEATILFDGEIDFPSLENLEVSQMHMELLQRPSETTIFSQLSRLTLKELKNLKALPTINSTTLRILELEKIACFNKLFLLQPAYMSRMSLLMSRELEELRLSVLDSLEEFFDDENSIDILFFSVKKLELRQLRQLKRIPWNILNSLSSLIIYSLQGWISLISTSMLVGGAVLPLLEYIKVEECGSLEAIVSREEVQEEDQDFAKYGITMFPCLRKIELYLLPKLESFSKGSYEAHFPSLETVEISRCCSLQEFSVGTPKTPRLKSVKVDSETMEANMLYDLNSAVEEGMKRVAVKKAKEKSKSSRS